MCIDFHLLFKHISNKSYRKPPKELHFGKEAHRAHNLRTFDQMRIVTTKSKIQGKLKDFGTACMIVGYPPNHVCDVYRMLNAKIKLSSCQGTLCG
jgi:hypothetical protein